MAVYVTIYSNIFNIGFVSIPESLVQAIPVSLPHSLSISLFSMFPQQELRIVSLVLSNVLGISERAKHTRGKMHLTSE